MEAHGQRVSAASAGLTSLALRLTKQLAANNKGSGNLVFSPLSIYTALALVAAGARGAALDELLSLLGAASRDDDDDLAELVRGALLADDSNSDPASGGPLIVSACGVWHDDEVVLKPAFRAAAVERFKAEVRAVDFKTKAKAEEARQEINSWVSEATRGLIADALPDGAVDGKTRLMLVNAIYFKGKWATPFDERRTEVEDFYLLDGTAVEAPLMRGGDGGRYLVGEHDGFKVLKLRYETASSFDGARYSLCVFLPDARDGLWSLVDELAASGPAFLHDHLPATTVGVGKLRLHRFKMSFSGELAAALREMGLETTLDRRGAADLSDMAERRGFPGMSRPKIEQVCHKAVIEVNEEGTEAAAVTYVDCLVEEAEQPGPPPETVDFVADHPFVFFVMEEMSGAVVFAGCVLDPSQ